jgi:tRNA wybutosine-synthesizing protein 3
MTMITCLSFILMCRWETLGDLIILPKTCFKDPLWESVSEELWPLVAKSLGAQRLARQVSAG